MARILEGLYQIIQWILSEYNWDREGYLVEWSKYKLSEIELSDKKKNKGGLKLPDGLVKLLGEMGYDWD